jgi:two-component system, NtrC family, sensor kinase
MSKTEHSNILILDNQSTRLRSYEHCLAELGENLILAGSSSEAISALLKSEISVVLIGITKPDRNGLELADMIRRHLCFEKIAIIFISDAGMDNSELVEKYDHEAVDYVTAPVQPEVLRAKVKSFLDLHRKTRTIDRMNSDFDRRVDERTDELLKSEAQLKMRARLLDIATEAIIVRDLNGLITFWNSGAEKTYGWNREEALGRKIHQLLQTTFTVPLEQVEKQLREQGSWHGRLTQTRKNGQRIVLDCRKTMNEENDAVLEVNRDITTEIKAEEVLRATEKLAAMGRVAGIIAHEINNPLAAITNIFYLLRNHPQLGDEPRALVERAEQELERVSHITRQTLSFYRETKQPILVFVPEILDDVLELQTRLLRENRITVRRKYQSAAPVTGFPAELRQVFLNLVGNAIQAMSEGGVLGVFVRETTDWTRNLRGTMVSIIDTGGGIQPEDAPQLFQPFFSTKSTKGTGLGLWISRGIVQKYEGRITYRTVRSKGGNVTCFRVFLPSIGSFDRAPNIASDAPGHEYKVPATH